MALTCSLAVNPNTYRVGNTPTPQLTLNITNPNAFAVTVLGVRIYGKIGTTTMPIPIAESSFPTGPGQNVTVAASGTLAIGAVPFTVAGVANNSAFQAVLPSGGTNFNPQPTASTSFVVAISATVTASDDSVNEATTVNLTVTPSQAYGT